MQDILVNRILLLDELKRVFDLHTAEVMLGVLDKVARQVQAFGVQREDFTELKHTVQKLAEAQTQTHIDIKRLTEAQSHTDERLDRIESAIEKLAESQAHTDKSLQHLSQQVGGLSETVGGDIEDIAYIVIHDVLKRELNWKVGVLERTWLKWGKGIEEIDILGKATDLAHPEKIIWIVGEAKHNLTRKEVEKFKHQLDRARKHLIGEIFPVCFCYRARPEVQELVQEMGIRLVFSYGKII